MDDGLAMPVGARARSEIDGAVHLLVRTYWDDMDRDNEQRLAGRLVLRFPSVAVRLNPDRVLDQIRRALLPRAA